MLAVIVDVGGLHAVVAYGMSFVLAMTSHGNTINFAHTFKDA